MKLCEVHKKPKRKLLKQAEQKKVVLIFSRDTTGRSDVLVKDDSGTAELVDKVTSECPVSFAPARFLN